MFWCGVNEKHMKKRIFALCVLFALLFGLAACSKGENLNDLLLQGEWSTGDGENIFRFYADGTGMRYYQKSGLMGSTITFRWELHGNKLKLQEIEEDSKDSDSGLTVSYTITNHTQYTIDLWEENGVVDPEFTLFLKDS